MKSIWHVKNCLNSSRWFSFGDPIWGVQLWRKRMKVVMVFSKVCRQRLSVCYQTVFISCTLLSHCVCVICSNATTCWWICTFSIDKGALRSCYGVHMHIQKYCVLLHCTLSCSAVYCNRPSVADGRAVWVCYHDKLKLRASILTKLCLQVKVVTISSWLDFGSPAPPGRGSEAGRKFLAPPYYLTTASMQCLCTSERFFHLRM